VNNSRNLPQTLQTYGIGAAFGALSPENSGAGAFAEVCGSPGEARGDGEAMNRSTA